MPYDSLEKRNKWASNNKDKVALYRQRWLQGEKGQEYLRKQQEAKEKRQLERLQLTEWKEKNKEKIKKQRAAKDKRYRDKRRLEAIHALGGECCACGMDDHDVLQFDHITPLMRRANKGVPKGNTHDAVLRLDDPRSEFQLLCANCHVKKTRINKEYGGYK